MSHKNQAHPSNTAAIIDGTVLIPGTRLQDGDVYDSPNGQWEKCPINFIGTKVDGRCSTIWVRPASLQSCVYCEDKKKTPTDLWDTTSAMWEPCSECCPEEYKKFRALSDDNERINWFSQKQRS